MSITTDEERLNRNRVLMTLPKCGLSKKRRRKVAKLIGRVPSAAAPQLRYGDGCISGAFPAWTGDVV